MKTILFTSLVLLSLWNCKSSAQDGSNNKGDGEGYTVSIKVTETRDYCGGAAPSEDILQQLATPAPKIGMQLYVRPGNQNNLEAEAKGLTTNDKGIAEISLTPGEYCLIFADKIEAVKAENYAAQFVLIDDDCCTEWGQKCELTISVAPDGTVSPANPELKLRKRCHLNTYNPCVRWDGPIPPSAAPEGD